MSHLLIADDDTYVLAALQLLLKKEGYTVSEAKSPDAVLVLLEKMDFDLVLMDLNYSRDTTSGTEGIELISAIRKQDETIPLVVMTGWGSIEIAVNTMQNGANDFLQKPWENDRLLTIVKNQTQLATSQKQFHKLQEKNQLLLQQLETERCDTLVVNSRAMQKTLAMIEQVAKTDANILLTGENGTGKSMFARYIHDSSSRKDADITSVNMGAVPESLFESEMFGHVKGAFTDAKSSRIGRFELADQGTLFLDEIANTPYAQQIKLLRVLEEQTFEKVGSSKTQTADVRLITATNADLNTAVSEGRFRKDLLFRINTIEIEIPPLRQRQEDILPLAYHFLNKAAIKNASSPVKLSQQAEEALLHYDWPGNIRELSHAMERAEILCHSGTISCNDLGLPNAGQAINAQAAECNGPSRYLDQSATLEEIESIVLEQRLMHFEGNALKAAKSLGLSRSAFYRRLKNSNNLPSDEQ